jgi:hypothetical protein
MANTDSPIQLPSGAGSEEAALESAGVGTEQSFASPPPARSHNLRDHSSYNSHWAIILGFAAIILLLIVGIIGFVLNKTVHSPKSHSASSVLSAPNQTVPLNSFAKNSQGRLTHATNLTINGKVRLNDNVILKPVSRPQQSSLGEFYFDKHTKRLYYYNGQKYLPLLAGQQAVTSLGGLQGAVALGNGLQVINGKVGVSPALLRRQPAASAGVQSLQGQTGNVRLRGGQGIAVNGTTIRNTGVVGLQGMGGQVRVTANGNGTYKISLDSAISRLGQSIGLSELENGSVNSSKVANNSLLATDLRSTNNPANNYIVTYDASTGGFAYVPQSQVADSGTAGVTSLKAAGSTTSLNGNVIVATGNSNNLVVAQDDTTGTITLSLGANVCTTTNGKCPDTNTTYDNGTGLNLDDASHVFSVAASACATDEVLTYTDSGFSCTPDQTGTDTSGATTFQISDGSTTQTVENGQTITVAGSPSSMLQPSISGSHLITYSLKDDSITSGKIANGTLKAEDLSHSNTGTNGYVLTYDASTGGFAYVSQSSVAGSGAAGVAGLKASGAASYLTGQLTLATGSNLGASQSGSTITLNLGSQVTQLGQTIQDGEVDNNLTISAQGSVADGALSSNVSLLGQFVQNSEISTGTILSGSLNVSNDTSKTNGDVLAYNSTTGGFKYVNPDTLGGSKVTSLNTMTGALQITSSSSALTVNHDSSAGTITLALASDIAQYGDTTANFTGSLQENGKDVCTTGGNCASAGGGVTTSGGTAGTLALFTASGAIGDSLLKQNTSASTLSLAGTFAATTLTQNGYAVCDTSGNCSSTYGGSNAGVASLNNLTGGLTLQGTSNQIQATSSGSAITLSLPQDIATTSSPTFAGLTVNGALHATDVYADEATLQSSSSTAHSYLSIEANSGATGGYNRPYINLLGADNTGVILKMKGDSGNLFEIGSSNGGPEPTQDYVFINDTGNVGIGTSSPIAKLDVAGDGNFTGTVSGAAAQSSNDFVTKSQLVDATGSGSKVTSLNTLTGGVTLKGDGTNLTFTPDATTSTITGALGSSVSLLGQTIGTTDLEDSAVTNAKLQYSTFGVVAGQGLTTGGTASLGNSVTLDIGAGTGITVNSNNVAVDNTVCRTSASATNPGNCTAIGKAGGDLTGNYPDPTINKLQGTKLTIDSSGDSSSVTGGQFLQYNGTAWVNQTLSGDVLVDASGDATIQANSVVLGADTTGNYVQSIQQGDGITITGDQTGGDGSLPTISLNTNYFNSNYFAQGGNSFGSLATLGTTDNYGLALQTNGNEALRIDTSGNVGIGTTTPNAPLTVQAASNSSPALALLDSSGNTALEIRTGNAGDDNTLIGKEAGMKNQGTQNTALGSGALYNNTTGQKNTASGYSALENNVTGNENTALGDGAGAYTNSEQPNKGSSKSVYLGNSTKAKDDGDTNEVVIGSGATGNGSNSVTLGNKDTTKTVLRGNVGIGTTNPQQALTLASGDNFATELAAPSTPTLSTSTSGGSLAANTYYYAVTASDGSGETVASPEASIATSGSASTVTVSWSAVPGASSYTVYRGTSSGAEGTSYTTTSTSFTDTGATGTSATPPTATTAYVNKLSANGDSYLMGGNLGIGTDATSNARLTIQGSGSDIADFQNSNGNVQSAILADGSYGTDNGNKLNFSDGFIVTEGGHRALRALTNGASVPIFANSVEGASLQLGGSGAYNNAIIMGKNGSALNQFGIAAQGTTISDANFDHIQAPDSILDVVDHGSPGTPVLTVKGTSSQTANLLQLQAGGNLLDSFDARGNLTVNATGDSSFAGRLGIGTTAPNYPLDVAGDLNASGYYRQNKQIVINTSTGTLNTFLGKYSGNTTTSGDHNTANGAYSLNSLTSGASNTAIGASNQQQTTTGSGNASIGANTLANNTTGSDNNALGASALAENATGSRNTALGSIAGYGHGCASGAGCNITGNTLLGYSAGYSLQHGANYNVILGYNAGNTLTTGAKNILIGKGVNTTSATASNELNIGNAIYGDLSTGQVGIGTSNPQGTLDVYNGSESTLRVANANSFLKLDSDGTAGNYIVAGNASGPAELKFAGADGSGGSTTWATFDTSGNFGIGTTSPTAKLAVAGSGLFQDSLNVNSTDAASANAFSVMGTSGDPILNVNSNTNEVTVGGGGSYNAGGRINFGERNVFVAEYNPANQTDSDTLQLQGLDGVALTYGGNGDTGAGYQDGLLLDKTGNVGIGTSNPQHTLDVQSAASVIANFSSTAADTAEIRVSAASGWDAAIQFASGGTGNYEFGAEGDTGSLYAYDLNHNRYTIHQNSGGDLLLMPDGGNVGIGTSDTSNARLTLQSFNNNAPTLALLDQQGHTALQIATGKATDKNIFIGLGSGENNVGGSGQYNVAVGDGALQANTTAIANTAIGYQALHVNTGGLANTAIGYMALKSNTTGGANLAIGVNAAANNTTGGNNVAIGNGALASNGNGSYDTAIGFGADVIIANGNPNNATAIGYNAKVSCSNCLVLGGTGSDAVNVGIGMYSPNYTLDVNGNVNASGYYVSGAKKFDVAESYRATAPVDPGEVVVFGASGSLKKATVAYEAGLAGVISTNPGITIGDVPHGALLALSGRVPVKVSGENGPIHVGDSLTSSATKPGYAMKATGAGPIIGTAIEPFDGDKGTIKVFVHTGYYNPGAAQLTQQMSNLQDQVDALGNSINTGDLQAKTLTVTGDATIEGDLTVGGTTNVGELHISGHIVTSGDAPTASALAAAGSGASVKVQGDDTAGTITVTAGSASQAGDLAKLSFSKAFAKAPVVVITPVGSASASLQSYVDSPDTSGFSLGVTAAPEASHSYTFNYHVIQ